LLKKILPVSYIFIFVLFMLKPEVSKHAASLSLVAVKNVVVATLFPMMVLCRLISGTVLTRFSRYIKKLKFWKRLNLSDSLISPILSGIVSGIPLGAIQTKELKEKGLITKEEEKKALTLSSVPSPAFVILVASEGRIIGVLRFCIILFANYFVTSLFPSKKSVGVKKKEKMTFSKILSSSAQSGILVSANIIFFTVLSFILSSLYKPLMPYFASFFEMGSGVINANGSPFFISLALGFCGLSAFCQIKTECPFCDMTPYLLARVFSTILLLSLSFVPVVTVFLIALAVGIKKCIKIKERPCKKSTLEV